METIQTNSNTVIELTNGTAFKLNYSFKSIYPNFEDQYINPNSFNMNLQYWIEGNESDVWELNKPTVSDGIIFIDPRGMITVMFKDYAFNNGRLMYRLTLDLPNQCNCSNNIHQIEGFTGVILN